MNQFYVPSAAKDIQIGMEGIYRGMQERSQKESQNQKLAEGARLLESGSVQDIARWNMENPGLSDVFKNAADIQDRFASKPRLQTAKDVLSGRANPREAYQARVDEINSKNGNAQQLEQMLATATDEELKRMAEIDLIFFDPKAADAYMKATASSQKPTKKMGSGDMSGFVFDEVTGQYSIDPEVKAHLNEKATAAANKAKLDDGFIDVKTRQGINKDVTALTKDVQGIHKAASSLEDLSKNASASAKLAAVFKFMKALDPTSVVRESEQGQVYDAQGAARSLAGRINALMGEGRLDERGFADIVSTAKVLANSAVDASRKEVDDYLGVFEDTLPSSFAEKIKGRVPESFQVSEPLPEGVTEADIEFTMKKHGVTREQVLERLGGG